MLCLVKTERTFAKETAVDIFEEEMRVHRTLSTQQMLIQWSICDDKRQGKNDNERKRFTQAKTLRRNNILKDRRIL